MSRRIALADQLYGGNVESTVLAPLCPNMVNGNMAKNPKTNVVQIMPLTQKDASHQC